jgi:hypothetical protein
VSSSFPEFKPVSPYKVNTIGELNPLVLGDIRAFLEQDPPRIPIQQVSGFTGWQAYSAFVNAEATINSTTYQALGGPTLEKMPPGQYVLWYGVTVKMGSVANIGGNCAPSINGANPASGSECIFFVMSTTADSNSSMSCTATLSQDGGNTIEILYLMNAPGENVKVRNRWLTALRYA